MPFDQSTRNRLAHFVSEARRLLAEEFTRQMQHEYGLDPAGGAVLAIEQLAALDDRQRETARILREMVAYYQSGDGAAKTKDVLERIVREQAFTVLNRLCALRMAEARGVIREAVSQGYQSQAFQLYARLAGSALGERGETYHSFLFSLFDELALDLPPLFDRFSPQGRLFPREQALLRLLGLLNDPELEQLWAEDETIGWIYQYFNSKEERQQMRAASQAPRNSRELAVRNQFFTPRYVVEFLTDNTLGRTWYEMTHGETALKDTCRYLVRRPAEVFLDDGQTAPAEASAGENLSQEELLRRPVYIPFRQIKDPRALRLLDPACGSMHFGLYAFDLFEHIYREAWALEEQPGAPRLWRLADLEPLHATYPDQAAFERDMPRLIIEHNLHGIDIDPRAVQIAGLSLWLRAHKSWQAQGLKPGERPVIRRSNIVCAEPMPGDAAMLEEFIAGLQPKVLGPLVRTVFDKMQLAGEAGSLLKIEEELRQAVDDSQAEYTRWQIAQKKQAGYLPGLAPERETSLFDLLDVPLGEDFWSQAEERVLAALREYAEGAENGHSYRRRLFAADTGEGFAFIDVCRKRYDVVVMNPPFGESSRGARDYLLSTYPHSSQDLLASFIKRFVTILNPMGVLGAITSRTAFFLSSFDEWRQDVLLDNAHPIVFADLGQGVLDSAMVETACYCLSRNQVQSTLFFRLVTASDREKGLLQLISKVNQLSLAPGEIYVTRVEFFKKIPGAPFSYWVSETIRNLFKSLPSFEDNEVHLRVTNPTADNFRFLRNYWECSTSSIGRLNGWVPYAKGGSSRKFYNDVNLIAMWDDSIPTYKGYIGTIYRPDIRPASLDYFFRPGIMWPLRASKLSAQVFPKNTVFSARSQCLFAPQEMLYYYLGLLNSSIVDYLFKAALGRIDFPEFVVGVLRKLPKPSASAEQIMAIQEITLSGAKLTRELIKSDETSHSFLMPELLLGDINQTLSEAFLKVSNRLNKLTEDLDVVQNRLNQIVNAAYGITDQDRSVIDAQWISQTNDKKYENDDTDEDKLLDLYDQVTWVKALISWTFGISFGRWNILFTLNEKTIPSLPDPFDPLPICAPGMLQDTSGLAVKPSDLDNYPICIIWSGILADDEGGPDDIEKQVRKIWNLIWKDHSEYVEMEACQLLGIPSFRDYFRKPNGFFADHLKRYSKSRRQAPIYWPLSTPSGSYTLWLYYHRLSDQTLFTCVNDFVVPKLKQVGEDAARLRQKLQRSAAEEKELERLADFEAELQVFQAELLRVAGFWKPNLNDGVEITAAPLWRLFQYKPWQKRLKETWEKLERGEYDWAHLAYSIWPERVREKCKGDKSLAIAHGVEEVFVEREGKKKGKKKVEAEMDEMFEE